MHHLDQQFMLAFVDRPVGTDPVPPTFDESQRIYQQGLDAYRATDYANAADAFVRAAIVLEVTGPYAGAATQNRSRLFENAAYAWVMAKANAQGRAALAKLRTDKRATDAELARAREVLE